jgi:hypothetical protein
MDRGGRRCLTTPVPLLTSLADLWRLTGGADARPAGCLRAGEATRLAASKKAEWIWSVLDELEAAGLVTLADKGYQGSAHAKVPHKRKNKS